MEGTYELISEGRVAGSVTVGRKGLYYHIHCSCFPAEEDMFRLIMEVGENMYDLGILIPANNSFMLQTRIPVKSICEGSVNFRLEQQRSHKQSHGLSISPEEPFRYLSRLERAYLTMHNKEIKIMFRNIK